MRGCLDEGILQSYFDGELSSEKMEQITSHLTSCAACAAAAGALEQEDSLVSAALAAEFALSVPSDRLRSRIDAAIAGLPVVNPAAANASGSGIRNWIQSLVDFPRFSPQRAFGYASFVVILSLASVLGLIQWRSSRLNAASSGLSVASKGTTGPSPSSKTETPNPPAKIAPGNPPPPAVVDVGGRARQRRRFTTAQFANSTASIAKVKLLPGERSYLRAIASLDTTIKTEGNRQMRPAFQAEYERNLALVDRAIAATRTAAKRNPNDPDAVEFMFAAYQGKVDLLNTVADARLNNKQH